MNTDDSRIKSAPVRDAHGRFVRAHGSSNLDSPAASVKSTVSSRKAPLFFDDLSFYGQAIRRLYKNDLWFFVIEDFFPLIQVTDPPVYINHIKEMPFYKELSGKHFFETDLSSQIPDAEPLIIGDQKALFELVKVLREEKKFFPGPFLQWIETTAQLSYEEQLERTENIKIVSSV